MRIDSIANIEGIVRLFYKVDGNRVFHILSEPKIAHASVVLANDIELTPSGLVSGCMKGKDGKKPLKNPHFNTMMNGAIDFFDGFVAK